MDENNQPVIETLGLTKVFRDFWMREKVTAVEDLDLRVSGRQVFGLLGPNGSGKSTTLKMILGLLFPTRGRIAVFGKRATDVAIKSRIGFLPEESYLYSFLDATETLDYYGRLFHLPRDERRRRIDMLLEMVGLSAVAYRRVGEYSKGMQRRIGLAQALINDPDLLILDEPTTGLDPIGTRQIKDLIRTLADRGKTVLLSSHLLADVEDVCDEVSILYGGRQREHGSIGDLLARHDVTEIRTDRLDDETLDRVRKVLADAGRDVTVSTPRDKLESLFLRIVEQARRQGLATGGAIAGGQVAEFLRAGEAAGADVLSELVRGGRETEATDQEGESKPPPLPAETGRETEEVLGELVGRQGAAAEGEPSTGGGEESEQTPPGEKTAEPSAGKPAAGAAEKDVDRSVLEDLTGRDDRDREGQ